MVCLKVINITNDNITNKDPEVYNLASLSVNAAHIFLSFLSIAESISTGEPGKRLGEAVAKTGQIVGEFAFCLV